MPFYFAGIQNMLLAYLIFLGVIFSSIYIIPLFLKISSILSITSVVFFTKIYGSNRFKSVDLTRFQGLIFLKIFMFFLRNLLENLFMIK